MPDLVTCDECRRVFPRRIVEEHGWLLLDDVLDFWLCPGCQEVGCPMGWPKREEVNREDS